MHKAVPVHTQRTHTPCLRSRLLDQQQLSSWLMVDSPTSAWELPPAQGPSLNNGSRSCGFHFSSKTSSLQIPICSSTSPCCVSPVSPGKEAQGQPPLSLLFKLTDIVSAQCQWLPHV